MKLLVILFSFFFLFDLQSVLACGYCAGDKAASVYSHKNRDLAKKKKMNYVSVELIGDGSEEDFKKAIAALDGLNEVVPKTIRSAYSQRAVSFVYQSKIKFEELNNKFSKKSPGWRMKLAEDLSNSNL